MNRINRFLRVLALGLGAALLLAAPIEAQVRKVDQLKFPKMHEVEAPKPTRVVLDNGMVVILIEDHELPLIDVSSRIRTGARYEPADRVGLAGLTGSVLRSGGTKTMNGDQLDEFLEGKAASIETAIGVTDGFASMSCLKEDFPAVLKVFAEVLRSPAFDADKLKIAKNQVVAGIARQNDDPQGILFREYNEVMYGGDSPYARSETYASVNAITREDLVAWHQKYFHPDRMILGVAGDFKTDEMVSLLKNTFGAWPKGPAASNAEAPVPTQTPAGVFYVEKNDMTQADILIGHLGIVRNNPDYYSVELLNQVMSGGFASRLFTNVRSKKGLAYAVNGGVGSNWDYPGTFDMFMTTKTETTGAGIEALIVEAKDLVAKPPTDEEVEKAKAGILNSFVFNSDSTLEILNQQLTYEYYGYPLDWQQRYRAGIEKVTTAQVREAAKKYVFPDKFAIVVVGPSTGMDKPLATYGKVTQLDITIPEPAAAKVAESAAGLEKGRTLVAKALEALGGAAAVDGVQRIDQKGRMTLKTPQGELEIKMETLAVFPDRLRHQMTLPFGTMTGVVTPEKAFVVTPQGVAPMPDSQRDDLMKNWGRNQVAMFKQRGDPSFKAIATGSAQVGGIAVEQVVVDLKGEQTTLSIDPANGRVVAVAYRGNGPMAPAPGDVAFSFGDFRAVEGLTLPFAVTGTFNGEPSSSFVVDSVTLNGPVSAEAFALPAAPPAAEKGGR